MTVQEQTNTTESVQTDLLDWYTAYLETIHICPFEDFMIHTIVCEDPIMPILSLVNLSGRKISWQRNEITK